MTIADQIYELVKALPQEQASEILTFAEFIRAKHQDGNAPINSVASVPWVELVSSLAGTWGEDFPNLEIIRTEPGQDIVREIL